MYSQKQISTPVLFLVFNRIDATTLAFEAIRKVKPKKLYIAADGPRLHNDLDIKKVAKVRKIATSVNWPCEVKTLFRNRNLGVKHAPIEAITWFFKHEEKGIILEDDCVPHSNFFKFCETLLNHYHNDSRIFTISGTNIKSSVGRRNETYHFSKYFHPWGWATWRRVWDCYEDGISFWPKWKISEDWTNKLPIKAEQEIFRKIFDREYSNKRQDWGYRFMACVLKNGGLTVRANVNLVNNIGFGKESTNSIKDDGKLTYNPSQKIISNRIIHPKKVVQNRFKDSHFFFNLFDDKNIRFPWKFINLPMRIIRYILRRFK